MNISKDAYCCNPGYNIHTKYIISYLSDSQVNLSLSSVDGYVTEQEDFYIVHECSFLQTPL